MSKAIKELAQELGAVIVTGQPAMVEYLRERYGLEDAEVLERPAPEAVRGKVVFGEVPFEVACEAALVVQVPLPRRLEGKPLTLEELRRHAKAPQVFQVRKLRVR
jgi:hypothetical protein